MAKADNDKRTADILSGRRPVGRPPAIHGPLTAAQRKAAQRAKAKAAGREQITVEVSAEIAAALRARCAATATRPERTQRELIEEILHNQLCRKR